MEKNKFILLIIITVLIFQPSSNIQATAQSDQEVFNNKLDNYLLKFWRADPELFNITNVKIFPIASIGINGEIKNLGRAWIAWTIQIGNGKIAAHAIYDKGKVRDFSIDLTFYEEIYWQGAQTNLFLIRSAGNITDISWFRMGKSTIKSSLKYGSSGFQMYMKPTGFELFLMQNHTIPSIVYLNGNSLVTESTNLITLDTIPNAVLYEINSETLIFRYNEISTILPAEFSNKSKVGQILLKNAVFDFQLKKAWIDNTIIDIPEGIVQLYVWGLKSSILRTENNTYYEYNFGVWEKLDIRSDISVKDLATIDIELQVGVVINNGIELMVDGSDEDGDMAPDTLESYYSTYVFDSDTDSDTIPDIVEIAYGMNPLIDDRNYDYDGDSLTSIREINLGLDPWNKDSDFGGAIDGWEVKYKFDALNRVDDSLDPDGDGATNAVESLWGSNPYEIDTDGDGIDDNWEISYSLDPTNASNALLDPDNDHKNNLEEYKAGTDPLIPEPLPIFSGLSVWFLISLVIAIPLERIVEKQLFQLE